MGLQALHHIEQSVRKPVWQPVLDDRLIWIPGKKGVYTVKEGCELICQNTQVRTFYGEQKLRALGEIWKWKGVIPRVILFVWRAIHGGLATTAEMSKRMKKIIPLCPRCGQENEYIMHMLFFCHISRQTWYISQLAIRVAALRLC